MNIFKLFTLLCLFWAVGFSNTAKAQFPAPLYTLDGNSLTLLRGYGFINPTFVIPSVIQTPADSILMRTQGVIIEWVSGEFRVVDLHLPNHQTQPFDMANLAQLFENGAFSQLRYLNLSNNQLFGSIGFNAGITVPTAMQLILNNNNLDSNSVSDFLIWFPNMVELHMESAFAANVQRLPSNIQLTSLKVMNFSRNGLLEIPATVFQGGFPNIETINFSRNLISALPMPDTIYGFSLLNSNIPRMPAYSGLANLKNFNVSHNQLRGLLPLEHLISAQLQVPRGSRNLQALNFSNNRYEHVADSLARGILDTDTTNLVNLNILNFFPNLFTVNVDSNALQFDDLFTIAITVGKRMNVSANAAFPQLVYANQDSIGLGGLRRRPLGRAMDFELPARDNSFRNSDANLLAKMRWWGVARNSYTWVWGDSLAIANNTTNQIYTIARYDNQLATGALAITAPSGVPALDAQANFLALRDSANNVIAPTVHLQAHTLLQASYIFPTVTNHKFPALTLDGRKKKLSIGECYDTLGQVINCQEIAVQINANATPAQLQEAREELGATVIDQCVCGSVELWAISDAYRPDLEANGAGTRRASSQASAKPGLKSADNNYNLTNNVSPTSDLTPSINIQGSRSGTRTVVAIIDSGTDPDHPRLSPFIKYNTSERDSMNLDADANCEKDDIIGFNYVDKNNVPYDDHGHGTIVGSIIAGFGTNNIAAGDTSIALLPIKYTNRNNYGTTFEASCAIYYAADHHINRTSGSLRADSVRVINASWGYTGEPCQVLKDAIEYAGTRCGILFVCSAGNESSNNELAGQSHYPSNYDLDNVLAVTAVNNDNQTLATYANYGSTKVDIATYGQFRNVLIPQSGTGVDSTALAQNGTSYATALVSRAAALLFNDYPAATFHAVKHALLHTATPLAGADATKIVSGSLDITAARQYFAGSWDKTQCVEILGTNSLVLPNAMSFISPNPTTTVLNLRLVEVNAEAVQITIVDVKGVVVYQANRVADTQIEISTVELAQGLYLLRLQTSRGVETHKFVKMNP
jgi:subtilisin family serine protease